MPSVVQRIVPNLWFADQAEEAAEFYVSIFADSRILDVSHYGKASAEVSGRPEGSVLTVSFQIEGQEFVALNGGPVFKFSPAVSFLVNCETQERIDALWDALTDGGEPMQCGWVTDKYGVTWQIAPANLESMLKDADAETTERVMVAMLQMVKLDIAALEAAYAGPGEA